MDQTSMKHRHYWWWLTLVGTAVALSTVGFACELMALLDFGPSWLTRVGTLAIAIVMTGWFMAGRRSRKRGW